jgi:hypothetical protein
VINRGTITAKISPVVISRGQMSRKKISPIVIRREKGAKNRLQAVLMFQINNTAFFKPSPLQQILQIYEHCRHQKSNVFTFCLTLSKRSKLYKRIFWRLRLFRQNPILEL